MRWSARTLVEEPSKDGSGFLVGVVHKVSVDIKGGRGVAVTKPSGDGTNVYSGSQQAGCVVSEVVKAYAGGAGALNQQAEGAGR